MKNIITILVMITLLILFITPKVESEASTWTKVDETNYNTTGHREGENKMNNTYAKNSTVYANVKRYILGNPSKVNYWTRVKTVIRYYADKKHKKFLHKYVRIRRLGEVIRDPNPNNLRIKN